jgi:hypothetical protein
VPFKEPFAGPSQVLRYLSRYTHRIAISNRRLVSADENGVTFKYKDYRIEGPARYKTMTLATDEFIRRFLIHVLTKGFHRIRHYGLLANGNRSENIAHARQLLAAPARPKETETPEAAIGAIRRAAAAMPVLRRPHDRHRDFRARMRAQAPAHAASSSNQDRHLMMPSSAIDARPDTRSSCRLSAGSDQARITTSDSPALPPPIPSRHAQNVRSHRRIRPRLAASRSRRPLQSSLSKPEPAAKSP